MSSNSGMFPHNPIGIGRARLNNFSSRAHIELLLFAINLPSIKCLAPSAAYRTADYKKARCSSAPREARQDRLQLKPSNGVGARSRQARSRTYNTHSVIACCTGLALHREHNPASHDLGTDPCCLAVSELKSLVGETVRNSYLI